MTYMTQREEELLEEIVKLKERIKSSSVAHDKSMAGLKNTYQSSVDMLSCDIVGILLWVLGKMEEHDLHCDYDEDDWTLAIERMIKDIAFDRKIIESLDISIFDVCVLLRSKMVNDLGISQMFRPFPSPLKRTLLGEHFPTT